MLRNKLIEVKRLLVTQSDLIEKVIGKVIRGFNDKDERLLLEVIEVDEYEINGLELKIEEMCTSMIALYQPEARYLRMILMIFKMTVELERIGDCVKKIAQNAIYLIKNPLMNSLDDLNRISQIAVRMVRDSITAFIDENPELARDVYQRDPVVDKLRDEINQSSISLMKSNPQLIEKAMHFISIINHFEKIADLSTNIAEEAVYVAEGKMIKHSLQKI